ncbi:putative enzyme [Vibrio chagasii]|nr:putative enzyme [Vibrio chagasii]
MLLLCSLTERHPKASMNILITLDCTLKALSQSRKTCSKYLNEISVNTFTGNLNQKGLESICEELTMGASKNSKINIYKVLKNGNQLHKSIGSKTGFNDDFSGINFKTETVDDLPSNSIQAAMTIMVGIAGLWHDIGKATVGFQNMLKIAVEGKTQPAPAVIRHEVISCWAMKEVFTYANNNTPEGQNYWDSLKSPEKIRKAVCFAQEQINLTIEKAKETNDIELLTIPLSNINSCNTLTAIQKGICWLILCHHKLPDSKFNDQVLKKTRARRKGRQRKASEQPTSVFNLDFSNYINEKTETSTSDVQHAIPFCTLDENKPLWRAKRKNRWLQRSVDLFESASELNEDNIDEDGLVAITAYHGRASLVFSDYYTSSTKELCEEGDPVTINYANTIKDKGNSAFADSLEKHSIGVARNAIIYLKKMFNPETKFDFSNSIHKNKKEALLNALWEDDDIDEKFIWQRHATKLISTRQSDNPKPTLAIVLSETGTGKTRANALCMMAMRDKPRFTCALGLKTLTNQTMSEYCEEMGLQNDSVALIGGEAFYHDDINSDTTSTGSGTYSEYENTGGTTSVVGLRQRKSTSEYTNALCMNKERDGAILTSPIVSMTIDHFTGATNLSKSVKLTSLLRMTNSDLILDEVDSYDIQNLGAIANIVFAHAIFGRHVILSSATLNPNYAEYLFEVYALGNKFYNLTHCESSNFNLMLASNKNGCQQIHTESHKTENFKDTYNDFTNRVTSGVNNQPKHKLKWGDVTEFKTLRHGYESIINEALKLHESNRITSIKGSLSIGVVRLNRIKDVQQLSIYLDSYNGVHNIKYVTYHSKFDNASRTYVEQWMQDNLKRKSNKQPLGSIKGSEHLFENRDISPHLSQEKDLIILFISTNIIEVGRDVDFDWGVSEVSSTQGLIQFLGRVKRHRNILASDVNVCILKQNLSEIESDTFSHIGVESDKLPYGAKGSNKSVFPVKIANELSQIEEVNCSYTFDRDPLPLTDELFDDPTQKWLFLEPVDETPCLIKAEYQRVKYHINYASIRSLTFNITKSNSRWTKQAPLSTLLKNTNECLKSGGWYKTNPLRGSNQNVTFYCDPQSAMNPREWRRSDHPNEPLTSCGIMITEPLHRNALLNATWEVKVENMLKMLGTSSAVEVDLPRHSTVDKEPVEVNTTIGVITRK